MYSSGLRELEQHGHYLSTPSGNSMQPLFSHRENVVEIVRAEHPLKRYDISLHVRRDGTCVLHRIMEVKDGEYVICGDNCLTPEIVPFDRVRGVAVRFYRNGKWIPVTDRRYQMYVHVWCGLFPFRRYLLKIRRVKCRLGKRKTG